MDTQAAFWTFFALWVTIGIIAAVFFMRPGNGELKSRVYPVFTIGTAILFAAFVLFMSMGSSMPLFMIPVLVLIVALNLRGVRFCRSCGRMIRSSSFQRPKFCDACGASLGE